MLSEGGLVSMHAHHIHTLAFLWSPSIALHARPARQSKVVGWRAGDKVKGKVAIEPCGLTGLESCSKCKPPLLGKRVLGDAVTEQKELFIEGRLCVSIYSRDDKADGRGHPP